MELNARVNVKFARGDINFQTVTDLVLLYFFFILIPMNIKVLLILHTKFQLNIPSHFGERDFQTTIVT